MKVPRSFAVSLHISLVYTVCAFHFQLNRTAHDRVALAAATFNDTGATNGEMSRNNRRGSIRGYEDARVRSRSDSHENDPWSRWSSSAEGNPVPRYVGEPDKWLGDLIANLSGVTRGWKARLVREGVDSRRNLCRHNHHVPELYIIGAQKASTTTFAGFFYQSPNVCAVEKELANFLDEHAFVTRGSLKGWYTRFPHCTTEAVRVACADSTPYLHSSYAPEKIWRLYGDLSSQLQFAVILRNPVERMFSAFWHYKLAWRGGEGYGELYAHRSFEQLAKDIDGGVDSNSQIYVESHYEPQMKRWFNFFSPEQFFIMMFKDVTTSDALEVNAAVQMRLWSRLGVRASTRPASKTVRNTHVHPTLEDEISPKWRHILERNLGAFADPDRLGALFARSGAELWACGDPCDEAPDVARWIRTSW